MMLIYRVFQKTEAVTVHICKTPEVICMILAHINAVLFWTHPLARFSQMCNKRWYQKSGALVQALWRCGQPNLVALEMYFEPSCNVATF